jgi:hypothetical protein
MLIRLSCSCQLLYANLLPSCRRRDADNERCLPTSKYPCSAVRCGGSWPSGRHTWSLSTFRACLRYSHVDRIRPLLDFQPTYLYRRMDRLSNTIWCWTRVSLAPLNRRSVICRAAADLIVPVSASKCQSSQSKTP